MCFLGLFRSWRLVSVACLDEKRIQLGDGLAGLKLLYIFSARHEASRRISIVIGLRMSCPHARDDSSEPCKCTHGLTHTDAKSLGFCSTES